MTDKTQNNKQYFLSIGLLCTLTYLLNHCTAIYQCALVFTVIAIMANALTYSYGKLKAFKGLAVAAVISFMLLWKLPYYIDGKIVNGLVFASLLSLMISMYWSTSVFQKLTSKFSLVLSNALSLVAAAVIDGVVMGLFFALNNNFSYLRILNIFSKELSYKMIYGFVASIIVLAVFKAIKMSKSLKS